MEACAQLRTVCMPCGAGHTPVPIWKDTDTTQSSADASLLPNPGAVGDHLGAPPAQTHPHQRVLELAGE